MQHLERHALLAIALMALAGCQSVYSSADFQTQNQGALDAAEVCNPHLAGRIRAALTSTTAGNRVADVFDSLTSEGLVSRVNLNFLSFSRQRNGVGPLTPRILGWDYQRGAGPYAQGIGAMYAATWQGGDGSCHDRTPVNELNDLVEVILACVPPVNDLVQSYAHDSPSDLSHRMDGSYLFLEIKRVGNQGFQLQEASHDASGKPVCESCHNGSPIFEAFPMWSNWYGTFYHGIADRDFGSVANNHQGFDGYQKLEHQALMALFNKSRHSSWSPLLDRFLGIAPERWIRTLQDNNENLSDALNHHSAVHMAAQLLAYGSAQNDRLRNDIVSGSLSNITEQVLSERYGDVGNEPWAMAVADLANDVHDWKVDGSDGRARVMQTSARTLAHALGDHDAVVPAFTQPMILHLLENQGTLQEPDWLALFRARGAPLETWLATYTTTRLPKVADPDLHTIDFEPFLDFGQKSLAEQAADLSGADAFEEVRLRFQLSAE